MCVKGLIWVLKALVGMEGIRCVGMGWDGCEGAWVGERVLKLIWKVQGEYGKSGMVIEALRWSRRALDWCRGPMVGVNGQGKVWMAEDGYRGLEGLWEYMEDLRWV